MQTKMSLIAAAIAAIAMPGMAMAQDVQVSTQRVFEVFVFIAAVYFVICFSLSRVFAALERRHAQAQH